MHLACDENTALTVYAPKQRQIKFLKSTFGSSGLVAQRTRHGGSSIRRRAQCASATSQWYYRAQFTGVVNQCRDCPEASGHVNSSVCTYDVSSLESKLARTCTADLVTSAMSRLEVQRRNETLQNTAQICSCRRTHDSYLMACVM